MALILDGTTGVPVTTVTGTLPVANGGSGVTTSTGTGAVVLGTSPTLTTPTFDSAQLATVSGTAPLYMCRAWVNFNGTGTVAIRASGNVSSITDNGTGDYTVNFTTAMPDANYAILGMSGFSNASLVAVMQPFDLTPQATGSVRIQTAYANTNLADYSAVRIAIFR
jgi:uncharacterized protein (AIM24 family)